MTRRPLRVLLITPDYPPGVGGIQTLLGRITQVMDHCDVHVLTPSAPGDKVSDANDSNDVIRVPTPGRRAFVHHVLFNLLGTLFLSRHRPDVIVNGHVVTAPLAWFAGKITGAPTVLYAYGKEVGARPRLTAWALRRSRAAVAISQYTKGELHRAAGPRSATPIYVVRPGVDVPETPPARTGSSPTIITVGRLRDRYKGHDMVMAALPDVLLAVPDLQWVIVGDGRIRADLEQVATSLGVAEHVHFVGAVSDSEKQDLLGQADLFVMPARYPRGEIGGEGFAIVYLEAAALGVPSLAGNVGGPAEAVVDGETGILIDPEDKDEIARSIVRLMSDSPLTTALGIAARDRVKAELEWPIVGRELQSVLQTVAQMGAPSPSD